MRDMVYGGRSGSGKAAAGFERGEPLVPGTALIRLIPPGSAEQCETTPMLTRYQPDVAEYLAEQCDACDANDNPGIVSIAPPRHDDRGASSKQRAVSVMASVQHKRLPPLASPSTPYRHKRGS